MVRVFFLIRSLELGGAERQLNELARGLSQADFDVTVCTLYDGGAMRSEFTRESSIALVSLGKRARWDLVRPLWRLAKSLRQSRPDVIHGYMGPANELAVLAARLSGRKAVCGIRASNLDFSRYDAFTRFAFRLGAMVSKFADAIIVNSHVGRQYHVHNGYSGDRMVVIPNGIDAGRFQPDVAAGEKVRDSWGVDSSERLVGLVARVDPMKDHETFLRAAALLLPTSPRTRFVCVGEAKGGLAQRLIQLAAQLRLTDRLIWAGARDDMHAVYSAIDVLVLSSAFGEGFPNAVAEGMAAARPCVVTDVGDSAHVVGDTGLVVPPSSPSELAQAIARLLALSDDELRRVGERARKRIVQNFSREKLVWNTARLLEQVVRGRPAAIVA